MGTEFRLTLSDVSEYLGYTRSNIQRLIRQGRIKAEMQQAPVEYYLVNPDSVEIIKNIPKNEGGRPKKGY